MIPFDISLYNDDFFEWHLKHTKDYCNKSMEWLIQQFSPKSIVDFGCGIGAYLEPAAKAGIKVQGFDISSCAQKYTPTELHEVITYKDCCTPIDAGKFDLVLSTETAEHIEPSQSPAFVENLVNACSDMIILTAAPPGQDGCGHINCQEQSFWKSLFNEKGFKYSEYLTNMVKDGWQPLGCPPYIIKNVMVFKKNILSVLMPTLPERSEKFNALKENLQQQILKCQNENFGGVEILDNPEKRFLNGGPSIGKKRDWLVQQATGEYVCFLDDDDNVADNYIYEVLKMCQGGKDAYTFNSRFKNDFYTATIQMSHDNKQNEQAAPNKIVKRTVWHVCAIRAIIAKSERFSDINHNEDWNWMSRVLPKIKTSDHIDMILHEYNHFENQSEADKILKNGFK